MILYNSETRQKEEFKPNNKNQVKMYTCGPTVYNYAHIGNLRTYIFEDVLEKALNYLGYNVQRAMNITDVGHLSDDSDYGDDKMVKMAEKQHKSVLDIAAFYTEAFKKDFEHLNLTWPEIVVPATSCVDLYIEIIKKLIEKDYAYLSNGNVYFDTSKLDKYYRFTNQSQDEMLVAARDEVEEDISKKNVQDFALWFTKSKFENQALKWDSPWGIGYPGWHIECSGISYKTLGEYLDIHCGGVDNKFPHHTNEIAQSESFLGHHWCNYWFHVEHLNVKEGKMSKSANNFTTVQTLIDQGYDPLVYKLFCLQSHYRKILIFSYEGLDSAKNAYNKLINKISTLNKNDGEIDYTKIKEFEDKFAKGLENDLNTATCVTVLFDVLKSDLNDASKIYLIEKFDTVLGLSLTSNKNNLKNEIDENLKVYILNKIEERKFAKQNKDYALADKIRNELLEQNIELIDTKDGTEFKIIK